MLAIAGDHFIARGKTAIIVGWRSDLAYPAPAIGEQFSIKRTSARFPSRSPTRSAGQSSPVIKSVALAERSGLRLVSR